MAEKYIKTKLPEPNNVGGSTRNIKFTELPDLVQLRVINGCHKLVYLLIGFLFLILDNRSEL